MEEKEILLKTIEALNASMSSLSEVNKKQAGQIPSRDYIQLYTAKEHFFLI